MNNSREEDKEEIRMIMFAKFLSVHIFCHLNITIKDNILKDYSIISVSIKKCVTAVPQEVGIDTVACETPPFHFVPTCWSYLALYILLPLLNFNMYGIYSTKAYLPTSQCSQ